MGGIWILGVGGLSLGFQFSVFGFRVRGCGFQISGFGFRGVEGGEGVLGVVFRVLGVLTPYPTPFNDSSFSFVNIWFYFDIHATTSICVISIGI